MRVNRHADDVLLEREIILLGILAVLHFVKLLRTFGDEVPESPTRSVEFHNHGLLDLLGSRKDPRHFDISRLEPLSLHRAVALPLENLLRAEVHRFHRFHTIMTHVRNRSEEHTSEL